MRKRQFSRKIFAPCVQPSMPIRSTSRKLPQSLDDLVQAGYIKAMPKDPFTNRTDTWIPAQDDTLQTVDQTEAGINDVHSGAQDVASDGTSYSSW